MNQREMNRNQEQNKWLWVTRPEFYLDENGGDPQDLDPSNDTDLDGGWWTCHRDTRRGDLTLLWRTRPRSDIAYLLQARSDAYDISDDHFASSHGWDYGCDYKPIFKFAVPLQIKQIRADPYLEDWNALRNSFQKRVFRFEDDNWTRVNALLLAQNRGYKAALRSVAGRVSPVITTEEEIEEFLVTNLKILERFGFHLQLWEDGQRGRQYICKGHGGRIDLLCRDKKRNRFVVIELKNVRAGSMTFAQVHSYMGWVSKTLAKGRQVDGLVISRGYDTRFKAHIDLERRISHIDLADLGLQ